VTGLPGREGKTGKKLQRKKKERQTPRPDAVGGRKGGPSDEEKKVFDR